MALQIPENDSQILLHIAKLQSKSSALGPDEVLAGSNIPPSLVARLSENADAQDLLKAFCGDPAASAAAQQLATEMVAQYGRD